MAITAHRPANPLKQRYRTPSLAIIEFVLDQLPHTGTAGQLLYLSLTQSYIAAPDQLHHELVFFNITSATGLASHTTRMSQIVKELQKGYVFLL